MSAEFADQFSWRHSNRVESSWCQVARCCQSRITRLVILTWASQFPVSPNKQAGHKSLPARFLRVEEGVGVAAAAPGRRGGLGRPTRGLERLEEGWAGSGGLGLRLINNFSTSRMANKPLECLVFVLAFKLALDDI